MRRADETCVGAPRDGPRTGHPAGQARDALRAAVASNPIWYHTMELAPGVVTPGYFNLRAIVDRLPWPDVRGKRCLDIATFDGFLAFELERRGAREVLATDLSEPSRWDWPPDFRAQGPALFERLQRGRGFEIARAALDSAVRRLELSVYDLSPDVVGRFDVVVCGSLLLHLREPLRALKAIRSVCEGVFLSAEHVRLRLSVMHRRRPLAELSGSGPLCQWWVPNAAGHRRMLSAAGFRPQRTTRPYAIPFGPGYSQPPPNRREWLRGLERRVLTGNAGVPHVAVLARPAI